MAKDSALDKAEEHIRADEEAGIIRQSPEARASAKLALAESFEKQERQETSVSGASAASEGGQNLGGTGGTQSLEAIESRLNTLRQGKRTTESQNEIKKLNAEKDSITGGPSADDVWTLINSR